MKTIIKYNKIKISLANDSELMSWSKGEVNNKFITDNNTFGDFISDGLFSKKIFGTTSDYECSCGKYKGFRYNNLICNCCGVKVELSYIRNINFGHIKLSHIIINPLFYDRILELFNPCELFNTRDSTYNWETLEKYDLEKEKEKYIKSNKEKNKVDVINYLLNNGIVNLSTLKTSIIMVLPAGNRKIYSLKNMLNYDKVSEFDCQSICLNKLYFKVIAVNNRKNISNQCYDLQQAVNDLFNYYIKNFFSIIPTHMGDYNVNLEYGYEEAINVDEIKTFMFGNILKNYELYIKGEKIEINKEKIFQKNLTNKSIYIVNELFKQYKCLGIKPSIVDYEIDENNIENYLPSFQTEKFKIDVIDKIILIDKEKEYSIPDNQIIGYKNQLSPSNYSCCQRILCDLRLENNTVIIPRDYFYKGLALTDIKFAIRKVLNRNINVASNFLMKNQSSFEELLLSNFSSFHFLVIKNKEKRYFSINIKLHDEFYVVVSENIMKKLCCNNLDLIEIYDILYKTNDEKYIEYIKEKNIIEPNI